MPVTAISFAVTSPIRRIRGRVPHRAQADILREDGRADDVGMAVDGVDAPDRRDHRVPVGARRDCIPGGVGISEPGGGGAPCRRRSGRNCRRSGSIRTCTAGYRQARRCRCPVARPAPPCPRRTSSRAANRSALPSPGPPASGEPTCGHGAAGACAAAIPVAIEMLSRLATQSAAFILRLSSIIFPSRRTGHLPDHPGLEGPYITK